MPHHSVGRGLLGVDMYASSLKFVNSLYNKKFGTSPRRVPAHMPHLLDRDIIEEMQSQFPLEFNRTSSHRVRSDCAFLHLLIGM
jgi:UDP-N-acetylglucosamine-lysosomal-enzyme